MQNLLGCVLPPPVRVFSGMRRWCVCVCVCVCVYRRHIRRTMQKLLDEQGYFRKTPDQWRANHHLRPKEVSVTHTHTHKHTHTHMHALAHKYTRICQRRNPVLPVCVCGCVRFYSYGLCLKNVASSLQTQPHTHTHMHGHLRVHKQAYARTWGHMFLHVCRVPDCIIVCRRAKSVVCVDAAMGCA